MLVTRLILLLFAARPDNAGIAFVLWISTPLAWPMSWIDATQPLYGARFERGTLVSILVILIGLYAVSRRKKTGI